MTFYSPMAAHSHHVSWTDWSFHCSFEVIMTFRLKESKILNINGLNLPHQLSDRISFPKACPLKRKLLNIHLRLRYILLKSTTLRFHLIFRV
jgi:hypothetical protein